VFEYLDRFDHAVTIVETGCTRAADNWGGDGCSTVLFDKYAQYHPGSHVDSVNISAEAISLCSGLVSACTTTHVDDSVHFLAAGAGRTPGRDATIDLLYLDSFDVDFENPVPAAAHCLKEFAAAAPLLREDRLVVADDSPGRLIVCGQQGAQVLCLGDAVITGKGKFVAEYAQQIGAETLFRDYQCGWTRMVGARQSAA
jgi:hypothetical protein